MSTEPAPLDRFVPRFDVRERFEITIDAPADLVLEVAAGFDMQSLAVVKAIFRLREKLMQAAPVEPRRPQGIVDETRSLGWGLLAEEPGRLIVCGATCQPWLADVKFTAIAPQRFVEYEAADRVKIAWTMESQPVGPARTRFAQETRVVATDAQARIKFRRYWRWARFGIVAIRLLLLPAVRRRAQRQWAQMQRAPRP